MKIFQAKFSGFCEGVSRAVEKAREEASSGPVYALGQLVHNEAVIRKLEQEGVITVDSIEDIPPGAKVLIRTHGAAPSVYEQAAKQDLEIIDVTCPHVRKLQKLVARLVDDGKRVIIAGDAEHPEVKALMAWGRDKPHVISETEQLEYLDFSDNLALISQTTQQQSITQEIGEKLKQLDPAVEIYDTICQATVHRQEAVAILAEKVDVMVVIGGKLSSNTRKLAEICRSRGVKTIEVTEADELDISQLQEADRVGLTAGASTPDWTIKEVIRKMEEEKNLEQEQVVADQDGEVKEVNSGVEETVAQVEDDEAIERKNKWLEVEKAFEEGKILSGNVKETVAAGIVIDLGAGYDGFMPGSLVDVRYIPDFNEFLNTEISFKIIEIRQDKEKVILSRKVVLEDEVASKKQDTLSSLAKGQVIRGTVKRITNFGAFVDVGGIDGLIHISEISWHRIEHPSELLNVGDEIDVKVIEVIPERERIGLSLRQALPDPWVEVSNNFKNGEIVEGKVTRLVNFGAFVELMPGVEGLVHISQMANYHVKQASEVVQEGQMVKVKILEINPDAKRVSLSIRDASPRPKKESVTTTKHENEDAGSGLTLGDVFGSLFEQDREE